MSKTKRQKLIKNLDLLVKQVIRNRDKQICQKCGKYVEGSNCHVSHVIPVSAGNKLRWDLNNMKVLCYHDHINWWHKNPTESGEWFKQKFPKRWQYLQKNKGIAIFKDYMLEHIKLKLLEKIGGLK